MNEVFSWSSGFILIWLYPKKVSIKLSNSCPAVDSTNRSMWGRGKISFGHALLMSVKSTQTLHFQFFFLTTTGLASQSGYFTSRIEPTFKSFYTSSFTVLARSGPSFLLFCFIGLKLESTCSSCEIILGSMPGISFADHANKSLFLDKKSKSSSRNCLFNPEPIFIFSKGVCLVDWDFVHHFSRFLTTWKKWAPFLLGNSLLLLDLHSMASEVTRAGNKVWGD